MGMNTAQMAGRELLAATEHGQRLLVAEEALNLIQKGQLPHLKRTVTNAVFVARAITDREAFGESSDNDSSNASVFDASEMSAYLMMNLLGVPQATLFYSSMTGVAEAELFGAYFPKLISMMYSAIGLDVERAGYLDKETLNKLLRAGIPIPG